MSNMKKLTIVNPDGTSSEFDCKDESARNSASEAKTTANAAKTTADSASDSIDKAKSLNFDEENDFSIEESLTEVKISLKNRPYTKDEIDEKLENFNTFSVTIGNRTYRTEKIGNKLWLAENLDYKFDGCTIGGTGTPTTANAWYYDNDEDTYGIDGTRKCGLLYNWYAVKDLEDNKSTLLPTGWHVPTKDEYTALIQVSGSDLAGKQLKALDNSVGDWPTNWNGIDEHALAVLPTGARNTSGAFADVSTKTYLWTSTESGINTSASCMMLTNNSDNLLSAMYDKSYGLSVRLVLDLNPDGSIPEGSGITKALATKEYVDQKLGNIESLLAEL